MSHPETTLFYIHGFNSSPQSLKARLLGDWMRAHAPRNPFVVPALPADPAAAMALLQERVAAYPRVALVGSSLGGFYATWLSQQLGIKAVLVNPAVRPWTLLDKHVGENVNYHTGERYTFGPDLVEHLRAFHVDPLPRPRDMLVLLQTGDETLDWRQAWDHYRDCHLYRGLGGSHGFDHFDDFIPLIARFCGVIT